MKKIILLLLFPSLLVAGSDIISVDEKRIEDYKKEITDTSGFPETFRLFYKGKQGDYVVFYDLNGHDVFFRYRRNKFDYEAEKIILPLTEGSPFEIRGEFLGMLVYSIQNNKLIPVPTFKPANKLSLEEKKDAHNIPVFKLVDFNSLVAEGVIF